jgi:hypothetical protein
VDQEVLQEIFPLGIIGDGVQAFAHDGEPEKRLFADPREDSEDGFGGLNGRELFEAVLGFHPEVPLRVITGSSPCIRRAADASPEGENVSAAESGALSVMGGERPFSARGNGSLQKMDECSGSPERGAY